MKINGRTFTEANFELVAIPRPDGPVIFKASAVFDYSEFEKRCPEPTPPSIQMAGSKQFVLQYDDPDYLKARGVRNSLMTDWLIIESLKATEGLEWDKVKEDDPTTWSLWKADLADAKFNMVEINRIRGAVWKANSLDEDALNAARQDFLASQVDMHK